MANHTIRKDKTCLNCNHVVQNKFCPNCGQENIEVSKSFHHLFFHFFEDLTHYENSFWKTIWTLIFKPGHLSKEYISGKRMSYLAPIRLYIFISFVTFLVISILPHEEKKETIQSVKKEQKDTKSSTNIGFIKITSGKEKEVAKKLLSPESIKIENLYKEGKLTRKEADTLISYSEKAFEHQHDTFTFNKKSFKSIEELDSIQKFSKNKLNPFQYWLAKKLFKTTRTRSDPELEKKFLESFQHNLPKALFIYMPIFAFLLWLFHSKKKWYYFDHGIFTLHYFSFLLTIILLYNILAVLIEVFFNKSISDIIASILSFIMILWFIFYFFRAHSSFYKESKLISRLKSSTLFFLNLIFMVLILTFIALYSLINIH